MWDKNKPLKLADALCFSARTIQRIIDADKCVASCKAGADLCGNYAPFCSVCTKWACDPCSTAYRISERMALMPAFFDSTGADDPCVIQAIADVDKYLASEAFGVDLCGRYAPFCAVCDKSQSYPCGNAYLRMKNTENFSTKALVAQVGGELTINAPLWDEALTEVLVSDDESTAEKVTERRIKIGTARRRISG